MPADIYCRLCDQKHPRPVGRNCKRGKVSDTVATAGSVSEPSQTSVTATALPADLGAQILHKLSAIDDKIVSFGNFSKSI